MKNRLIIAVALFLGLSSLAVAQTPAVAPTSTFSASASAIALPGGGQTVAGTIVGALFAVSPNLALRSDNMLVPAANLQGYYGGFNYTLPSITNKIQNVSSTIDGNHLQVYLTASAGIDHFSVSGAQHYSFLAGGGLRYDPLGNKNFSVNCEVRWAKLPGYANSTAIVSLSPTLRF